MREGVNPAKLNPFIEKKYFHRIIIPVFIPDFNGYFKNIFEVYKICLESAWLTQHGRSAITVVDNGSCIEAKTWLNSLYESGKIETLISHSKNIGKVDAILGAARSCREDLITISDSDILFRNGWQEAVEKVFLDFPKAGSVAPFPISRHLYYYSSSTQMAVALGRLSFSFEKSPNWKDIQENYYCYNWSFDINYDSLLPVVRSKTGKAVLGSGHQVMTIRREAIFSMPSEPCFIKISSSSESNWIDRPIDEAGFWRLSTFDTWVYHMGNHVTETNLKNFKLIFKSDAFPELIKLPKLQIKKKSQFVKRVLSKYFKIKFDKRPPAPKLKIQLEQDRVL
ncbi:glycosyltransferase family A protein [Algoriphagus limi]|uniref:Glycosyltransferase family 2 protein n=1 Tax=Algoriphagus limi TaxID=2975273 RepID=A0ABT2G4M2_9BACT|nr:glycosyltransferase family A protein [Algoriphagus limi]MCS5488980.1 glycosyltransferase family 2 protein [Algoriphagus limi]